LWNIQSVLPKEFKVLVQSEYNQGEMHIHLRFIPEFLSSNKRKREFGTTFLAQDGQAVVGGVLDVTGAVGKRG
jgi:hypothetical protein